MAISIEFSVCKNIRPYHYSLVYGRILRDGKPVGFQEVWLELDGELISQAVTGPEGKYIFHLWLPPGSYNIRVVAYRVPQVVDGKHVEATLRSEYIQVFVRRPSIVSKIPFPLARAVQYRVIRLQEYKAVEPLVERHLEQLGYRYLGIRGGLRNRGYTCQDVDVCVSPKPKDKGETITLERELMDLTCLPIEVHGGKVCG